MWRQNQRPRRFLLSAFYLLQCSYPTVSQLQRISNSACDDIVCPGELVQYECVVGSGIVVWEISGCGAPLQIVYQQGLDAQEARNCEDGKNITADLQQVATSSFRSVLAISGVQLSPVTIQCSSDDGSRESLIGMDELISTAPAPDILQQLYTNDSRIVVMWDSALEGCSSLDYNFTQSGACGNCGLAIGGNTVICTDGKVDQCSLVIQTFVCGVEVNESIVTNITSSQTISITSSPTMSSDITTSNEFLNVGQIAGIVVAAAAVVLLAIVATCAAIITYYVVVFCRSRRQTRKLDNTEKCQSKLSNIAGGEEQTSGSGEVKKMETSLSNDSLGAELGEGLKALDTSTPERECGCNEHIKSEMSVLPPANASGPANSNSGLEFEMKDSNAGGTIEDPSGDQLFELIDSCQRKLSGVQEEGYDGSLEEDHQPSDVTGDEIDSASSTKKSEASPKGYNTQPNGRDVDKTLGIKVDKGLRWPVEESSKDVGSASEEHVQVTPVSSLTRKDPKQKHKHTEVLPSIGADRQPSLTPTSAIKETSQEPPSPTDPFVNGTRMFPPSSTHRSEPQHFHINPPNDDHAPAQQETEGRAVGATGGGKHSDIMEIRSMLQSMNSKLESMKGNNEKIVAVEKKLDDSVQENKEDMEALEKKLSEKIRKRDKRIIKLEEEVSTLRSQCADLERKLQDEGEKHKEELQTLKEKAATELQEKQNEIDKLKNEKEQLKAQFNKKRSSYTSQWGTL